MQKIGISTKVYSKVADETYDQVSQEVIQMKVEKSSSSFIPPSVAETSARVSVAKSIETPVTPEGVSVNLGSTNQLRSIESTVANSPTVDNKKVADIKQAISEGRFQINSSKIADSLISDVNDLISADKR